MFGSTIVERLRARRNKGLRDQDFESLRAWWPPLVMAFRLMEFYPGAAQGVVY